MNHDKIILAHGSGGKLSNDLLKNIFLKDFTNPILEKLDDMAILNLNGVKVAFTTDSYVVNPIFFNGGDIGKLAICGTVNDLSMSGAVPKYISAAFVIEEGFPVDDLKKITGSMRKAAEEAGVEIVTGDTKVVEKGSADKIFINTAGIGLIESGIDISGSNAKVGDRVILSGTIGDHGIAIMSRREGLEFKTGLKSDCAPLNQLVQDMLQVSEKIRCLRDPTRGGLATILNEIAKQSGVSICIKEEKIPVKEGVGGACEMLGFDPLYVANEGKLIAVVDSIDAEKVLKAMKKNKYGKDSQIIGEIAESPKGKVLLKTFLGTRRIIDVLVGEQLPRIC
ncbi:hydrogenase expression/formation protein HypE [Candidatus Oleimmundimicrobium sp.]|uniref:hydrogenase expression/formation protein HypE n=1 Tax=Candidatus Oleimmundimicrobium sp. TaxID=3060597 RepID=UPI002728D415|nr:hydrogenase expression/formation protein HypE [Candidatus Oleimmundimicrobium sp.]MDO8886329.1 hydrogenase expression/formation protein HypE [Candidatus Oleimmundimicrobium sp.]